MDRPVVVGDIGGTNARWALYDGELGPVTRLSTSGTRTLKEALYQYVDAVGCEPGAVCVGVAGPVVNGRARLTNVDWTADAEGIPWPTTILNDLEAVAYGVGGLSEGEFRSIRGSLQPGSRLVVGVGTGFGGALLNNGIVTPMEPGHEPLIAFDDESEQFIAQLSGTVEQDDFLHVEHIVSGTGLTRLLRHAGLGEYVAAPGTLITRGWCDDERLAWVRHHFLRCLGHTLGRLAVENECSGGIFIAGGAIVPWIPDLSTPLFLDPFNDQGDSSRFAEDVSIHIIANQFTALMGASRIGRKLLQQ